MDKLTGAAGPVFVTLAIVLLSMGVFCFCESFEQLRLAAAMLTR